MILGVKCALIGSSVTEKALQARGICQVPLCNVSRTIIVVALAENPIIAFRPMRTKYVVGMYTNTTIFRIQGSLDSL